MGLSRNLAAAFLLALMLLLGQQGGLLHALAHGVERISGKQDPKAPGPVACLDCGATSQLLGLPAAAIPAFAVPLGAAIPALFLATGVVARVRVVFRTRGPPHLA